MTDRLPRPTPAELDEIAASMVPRPPHDVPLDELTDAEMLDYFERLNALYARLVAEAADDRRRQAEQAQEGE